MTSYFWVRNEIVVDNPRLIVLMIAVFSGCAKRSGDGQEAGGGGEGQGGEKSVVLLVVLVEHGWGAVDGPQCDSTSYVIARSHLW
jgi:hypothetical protein